MEYVSKINIFGLEMMVKSGLEKIILLYKNTKNCKFSNKHDLLCAWRDSNKTFCDVYVCMDIINET